MPMSGGKRNHEDVSANSPHNYCTRALRASHSVRCPQPWPRPTSHVPDGGAAETASAARAVPSHPAPATPGSRLLSQPARRSLRRAVWRNPKSLPTACLLVASERIRAARQHGTCTARSSAMAACSPELAFLTARLPTLLHGAPCGAHILQQRHEYTGVAASCRYARTPRVFLA